MSLSALRVPIWIAAAYTLLTSNADPDLFGHLRFGLDHLRSGHMWTTDPYSFTSDLPWIDHEWLSELIMAVAYSLGGTPGLVVMKVVVTLATVIVIMTAVKDAPSLWRWLSALLAVLGTLPITLMIRPGLWTLFFLTLTCAILTGPWKRRYWLPLIFLFWANMHGGWIVGVGVLTVWSAFEFLEPDGTRPPAFALVAVPAMCVLATLINPYGWLLWQFLASTVRLTREDILEWQPIWRAPSIFVTYWIAGLLWTVLAIRQSEKRPMKAIAVAAILAYGSMRVLRLIALFVPSVVILLIPYVRRAGADENQVEPRAKTFIDGAFACIGVAILAWPLSPGCIHMTGPWLPDSEAARAISRAHPAGRMVSWFAWGEYAIWHFGPGLQVSVDGRRETVYSEHVLDQQRRIADGDPAALAGMQQVSPEYAWLPQRSPGGAKAWFANHGYRIDINTPVSFLAVREDLPMVLPVAGGPNPCFPGP
jgi:hypothetical protein